MPKIIENPYGVILEHAKRILYNEGYENLSMRNVARSCGIGTGTIYNYFPTKEDLIRQIIVDYWDGYLSVVHDIGQSDNGLFDKLHMIYEQLKDFVNDFKEVSIKISMELNHIHYHIHSQEDLNKKKNLIEKLIREIESILLKECEKYPEKFDITLSTLEIAKFIIQNFIIMALTNEFEYNSFEVLLKKLINRR